MYVTLGQASEDQRMEIVTHQAGMSAQIATEITRLEKDAAEIQTYLRDPSYELTKAQRTEYTELLKQIKGSVADLVKRQAIATGEVRYQQKRMAERRGLESRKALAHAYFMKKAQESKLGQRPRGLRAYVQALRAKKG